MGCKEDGCDGSHHAFGMCAVHYRRWKRAHTKAEQVALPDNGGACVRCGERSDCNGEARWCRQCFHVVMDAQRERVSRRMSAARNAGLRKGAA